MHFLFSLLRTKRSYTFRALLAHLQDALHKRHLVYCVRVIYIYIYIYKNLVPTSQSKHCIFYKACQLMLLREINTAYCYAEHMNTPCGKILDFLEVLHLC
jgi:hypothetical protein